MEYNDGYVTMKGSTYKYNTEIKLDLIMSTLNSTLLFLYIDSIVCSTDRCHLAWLVRDNRDLLNRVLGGSCWDLAATIYDLTPLDYANC